MQQKRVKGIFFLPPFTRPQFRFEAPRLVRSVSVAVQRKFPNDDDDGNRSAGVIYSQRVSYFLFLFKFKSCKIPLNVSNWWRGDRVNYPSEAPDSFLFFFFP